MYKKILSHNKLLILQDFDDANKNIQKVLEEIPNKNILITTWFAEEFEAKEFMKEIRR